MEFADRPTFDHRDRTDIYEYVERHGLATADEIRSALDLDERRFGHQMAILRRDGVIEEADGGFRVAFDDGSAEEFSEEGVDFKIRRARQADLTGLVGVMRQVVERGDYVVAETVADLVDHERVLLRHNELEARMFFVATVDDDVVGWVSLDAPEMEKLAHTAELTVGVLETYRGFGIGSHLLARGVEWARSQGYEKIYQSLPSTNEAAKAFLEDHGWEVEAVRADHYKLDGEYVDEVMMARRLA